MQFARARTASWLFVISFPMVLSTPQSVAAQRAPVPGELPGSPIIAQPAYALDVYAAAPICDGSRAQTAAQKKRLGRLMEYGGLAGGLLGLALLSQKGNATSAAPANFVVLASTGTVAAGYFIHRSGSNMGAYAEDDIAKIRTGQTRAEDVEGCLGRPSSVATSGTEETWTYMGAKPGMFGGGTSRSVMITFRNGVVSDVRRTSSGS